MQPRPTRHDIQITRLQRFNAICGAAEGQMHGLDIFLHHQPGHGDLADRAIAHAAIRELAGILPGLGHKIAPAAGEAICLGNHPISAAGQAQNGRGIAGYGEIHAAFHQGTQGCHREQHHHRSIRGRATQLRQKPKPRAARFIFQADFLAQRLAGGFRHCPGHLVRAAALSKGNQQRNAALLRLRERRRGQQTGTRQKQPPLHGISLANRASAAR